MKPVETLEIKGAEHLTDEDVTKMLMEDGQDLLEEKGLAEKPEDEGSRGGAGDETLKEEAAPAEKKPDTAIEAYKALGTPEEIKALKEKYAGLDDKTIADLREGKLIPKHRFDEVSNRQKPAQKEVKTLTPEEQREAANIRKFFLGDVAPEMKDVIEILPYLKNKMEEEKADYMENLNTAKAKIEEIGVKDFGINPKSDRAKKLFLNDIADIINDDPKLVIRLYKRGDMSVLDEAKKIFKDDYASGFRRAGIAEIIASKRGTNALKEPVGKAPEQKKSESIFDENKMLSDIGDAAFSFLEDADRSNSLAAVGE